MENYKKVGLKRPRKRLSFVSTTIHSLYWGEVVLNRYVSIANVKTLYPTAKKVTFLDSKGRQIEQVISTNQIFK